MRRALAVAALPVSFLAWNPWGLVGRHEIRLLIGWGALAFAAWTTRADGPGNYPPTRLGVAGGRYLGRIVPGTIGGLVVLSAAFAGSWRTTLLGHADRHLGVLGLASLGVAVLVGRDLGPRERAVLRVAVEAAGALVGLVAVIQALGGTARPGTAFGSAGYTAAALVLALPFLLDRIRTVPIAGVGAAVAIAGLVLTGSRGGWLGGLVGLAGVAWLHRARRHVVIGAAAGAAVAAVTFVVSSTARGRLGSSGSVGGRWELWKAGLRAVVDRPLLGWGPERARVGVPPHLSPTFEQRYWDQLVPDRVHNVVLDTAVTLGVPATVLIVGLAAAALARAARPLSIWVVTCVAYVPFLAVNFVQLDVDLTAAVIFGCVLGTGGFDGAQSPAGFNGAQPPGGFDGAQPPGRRVVAAVLAVGAVYAGALVVADVLAERGRYEAAATVSLGAARYHEMQARSTSGQVAIDAADAALRQHPDDFWFGELAAQVRATDPATAADAIDRFDELIARWPNHGPFHNGRGVALATLGRGPEAHAAFEQATVLSPLSPEAWENQARMFLAEGSPQEARRVLDQGIARAVRTERLVELRNSLG